MNATELIQAIDGYPLYEILDGRDIPELSKRERRLLEGAVIFHTTIVPDRVLRFHVYDGEEDLTPRTTDDRTFDGKSRIFRRRLFSFSARGLLGGAVVKDVEPFDVLTSSAERHLHISPDSVLESDPRRWQPNDLLRKVARQIRGRAPILYDELRDIELLRHTGVLHKPAVRRSYESEFLPGGQHQFDELVTAGPVRASAPAAVIIGIHWFELGGAERWALETIRIVRDAGLIPIVISNVDSHHPFIGRAELDGAVLIPLSQPTSLSQPAGQEPLLRALMESFDVRGVVVHHNQWLYDRLPWISRSRPGLPMIDSTHIVEWRGGGYAMSAVLADAYITRHHVISPALRRWMVESQAVDPTKIVMAPLLGLTVDKRVDEFKGRAPGEPFTVAFVGRMARQKAPEVFVEAARRIHRRNPEIRFILHGDGEHASWVDSLVERGGLSVAVQRRTSEEPVTRTLEESHLLLVTSANEGLTLTSLEAVAHGVPVLSTDVGAQADIVPRDGLVSRAPRRAVKALADRVIELASNEDARRDLWRREVARERALMKETPASEWFEGEVHTWSKSQQ